MAFDWMEANSRGRTRGPKAQLTEAVLEQAGLLRRLGYDAKHTTTRCLANVAWQYDGLDAPLSQSEIKKLVGSVYR